MRKATLLFVLPFVASCGKSADVMQQITDYRAQLDKALCHYDATCGGIARSEEAQCPAQREASRAMYPAAYDHAEAVGSKRLAFDETAVAACISAIQNAGCTPDQLSAALLLCNKIYQPLVAVGAACRAQEECTAGYCEQGPNGSDGCAGTCTNFLAEGATCDPNNDHCAGTDFCDGTTKKCTARVGSGVACGDSPQCTQDLFCIGFVPAQMGQPGKQGSCKPQGQVGDECGIDPFTGATSCTPGLYCDLSGATSACKERLAPATDCSQPGSCVDGFACVGLKLNHMTGAVTAKGKCTMFADVGAACDPTADDDGCPADTNCDAGSKTCVITGPAGADCSNTATGTGGICNGDLYCDSTTNKCTASVPLGGACTPPAMNGNDPCHDGTCDANSGTCTLVCM